MTTIDTDRDALLASITAAPHDAAPRLIYADWLDEHGEENLAAAHRFSATADFATGEWALIFAWYASDWDKGLHPNRWHLSLCRWPDPRVQPVGQGIWRYELLAAPDNFDPAAIREKIATNVPREMCDLVHRLPVFLVNRRVDCLVEIAAKRSDKKCEP